MNAVDSPGQQASASGPFSPQVSVITPVLNGKRYLMECIDSVLSQSYTNVEHVFVDGGSTDGTLDLLAECSSNHPGRIRFMTGKDRNAEDAWNKGICAAQGEILGWLGADDVYFPGALEAVMDFFKANPQAAFAFGGCDEVDEHGQVIRRTGRRDFDLDEALNDPYIFPSPSAFFKKQIVSKIGLLDTNFAPSDFDYWIRIAKVYSPHRIEKVLSQFRVHSGSTGGAKGAGTRYAYAAYKISRKHGGRIFSRRLRHLLILEVADFCRPALQPVYPWIKSLIHWPSQ